MVLVGLDASTETDIQAPEPPVLRREIVVYVSGEVHNPGIVEFCCHDGARIVNAIEAAGGMTTYADPNAINLAARLSDAQHIVVFSLKDNMPPSADAIALSGISVATGGPININTASSEQLQTLSGIGPVTAANIINHREARGGFAAIEEIMNVRGIGEVTFENIMDRITVD